MEAGMHVGNAGRHHELLAHTQGGLLPAAGLAVIVADLLAHFFLLALVKFGPLRTGFTNAQRPSSWTMKVRWPLTTTEPGLCNPEGFPAKG